MSETLVLCGGEEAPRRYKGKCIELELGAGAAPYRRVDFCSEQISAALLDDLPDIVADALEIAVYVYSADRLVKRQSSVASGAIASEWQRRFHFQIPVRCPDIWTRREVGALLTETLSSLSGDVFRFQFKATSNPLALEPTLGFNDPNAQTFRPESVILFSGGLDSLAGVARDVVGSGNPALLVTHQSANAVIKNQNSLADKIKLKAGPNRVRYAPVRVRRGTDEPIEHSQRLRSFLFASLGLAYARMFGLDTIHFYENGITSFNLPVAEHVVGTRASRTTHPRVLAGYGKLFSLLLDREVKFENPFLWMTKSDVVKMIGECGCGDLIPLTTSCASVRNYSMTGQQCGTCSQCVERRVAMVTAGMEASDTGYLRDIFLGPLEGARDLTMAAGHLSRARMLARATPSALLARNGQILRAIRPLEGPADYVFTRIFELHRRYGQEFEEAVNLRFRASATIEGIRGIHPQSLLGILLPDAGPAEVRRDAAELESTLSEAPVAMPRSGNLVLAVDDQRCVIWFAVGFTLTGVGYRLVSSLARARKHRGQPEIEAGKKGYLSSHEN